MTLATAGFETGVNGNTIAIGDAGNASAWAAVNIPATGTATYTNSSPALGTLSGNLTTGGTTGQCYLEWGISQVGTISDHYGRAYMKLTAFVAGGQGIRFLSTGTTNAKITVSASGKVLLADVVGTQATGLVTLTANQWFRLEWHVIHSATVGYMECRVYQDAFSDTLTEFLQTTALLNTGVNINTVRFGNTANQTNLNMTFDGLRAGDTAYAGASGRYGGMLLVGVG